MSNSRNPSDDGIPWFYDLAGEHRPGLRILPDSGPIDTASLKLLYSRTFELLDEKVAGGYHRSAQIHPAYITRLGGQTMESYCYNDTGVTGTLRAILGPQADLDSLIPCPIDLLEVRQYHATTWLGHPPLEFSTQFYVGDKIYRRDPLRTHLLRSAAMSLVLAVRGGRLRPRVPRSVMVRNRHDGLFLTQDGAGTTLLGTQAGVFYPWEAQDIYTQQPDRWVLIDRDSLVSLDISTRE